MANDPPDEVQRWTAKRRVALVLEHSEGGDVRPAGGPEAWADCGRARGLAGALPARRGEWPAGPPQGPRGPQGRAHQEAEAEDRRARPGRRHPQGGREAPPFPPGSPRRVERGLPARLRAPALPGRGAQSGDDPPDAPSATGAAPALGVGAGDSPRGPDPSASALWVSPPVGPAEFPAGAADHAEDRLPDPQTAELVRAPTPGDAPAPSARARQAARSNERWATDLTHVYCGADGWAHLAAVIDCHDREIVGYEFARRGRAKEARTGARGRPAWRASGNAAPDRRDARHPLRQWAGLSEPAVPGSLSRLSAAAGVHHPVHARAKRHHRALLPESERRVCLVAPVRQLRGGAPGDRRVDPLVQRGASAPGAGLSEPTRTPGARSSLGGLISGGALHTGLNSLTTSRRSNSRPAPESHQFSKARGFQ
jgi:hypothetical protein